MVDIDVVPEPQQIRSSNSYGLASLCWLAVDVTRPLVPGERPLPPASDGIYSAPRAIQGNR